MKATVERGFGQLKQLAAPLFKLTDCFAEHMPGLRDADLAQATATLIVRSILGAYRAGSRAARRAFDAREGISEERLTALAAESREHARATERSKRLFLQHIHELYQLGGSAKKFVRELRKYPLEALHEAERRFRKPAQRGDLRDPTRYLAAIVRNCAADLRARWNVEARDRELLAKLEADAREKSQQCVEDEADPVAWLERGLRMLSAQWHRGTFIAEGHGLGIAAIRGALRVLLALPASQGLDTIAGVLHRFSLVAIGTLGPDGVDAVKAILDREVLALLTSDVKPKCQPKPPPGILLRPGETGRPQPIGLSN